MAEYLVDENLLGESDSWESSLFNGKETRCPIKERELKLREMEFEKEVKLQKIGYKNSVRKCHSSKYSSLIFQN